MLQNSAGFKVEEATIIQVQAAFQEGRLTVVDLVSTYLDRIERLDRSTGLQAIVVTNPQAIEEAAALDEAFQRTGKLAGPMHGVPVIVKDNYETAGLQTTAGSASMEGYRPRRDAFMVRRLREAGAIVLAKSNMDEWAFTPFRNISSILGETRNAYDLTRVSAGSSGGTASAIAANFGLVGLGTDTGNSIRGPASHLSLVGLRPTLGLTSRSGIVPQHSFRDTGGPMTRSVEDTARVLDVIAGHDPDDPITRESIGRVPESYTTFLDRDGLQDARIGVLRRISNTETADPEILAIFEQALEDLRACGAEIVDPFDIPNYDELSADLWGETFQHDLNRFLASADNPPVRSLREIYDSGKFSAHIKGALEKALTVTIPPDKMSPPCLDHLTDPRRIRFRQAVVDAMGSTGVNLIAYPTWSNPPQPVGVIGVPYGNNSPRIAPHTGQPAITVPMGFTTEGLPAGLQFVGRMFDEPALLAAAYAFEQATSHRRPPPLFRIA